MSPSIGVAPPSDIGRNHTGPGGGPGEVWMALVDANRYTDSQAAASRSLRWRTSVGEPFDQLAPGADTHGAWEDETAVGSEGEERYRRLVELSPYAVAVHRGGRLIYANPAAAHLVGARAPAEILGVRLQTLIHPDYRAALTAWSRGIRARGNGAPTEAKLVALDGRVVDVEITSIPSKFGGRPATQVLIRDTTQQKRTEQALRESRDELV